MASLLQLRYGAFNVARHVHSSPCVKTRVGIAIVLVAAGALFAAGHEIAATVVAIGGALVVFFWHKLLGKLGVRSSR
jgi:phage-related tail protein